MYITREEWLWRENLREAALMRNRDFPTCDRNYDWKPQLWRRLLNFRVCVFVKSAVKKCFRTWKQEMLRLQTLIWMHESKFSLHFKMVTDIKLWRHRSPTAPNSIITTCLLPWRAHLRCNTQRKIAESSFHQPKQTRSRDKH